MVSFLVDLFFSQNLTQEMMSCRQNGTCKWFNAAKGFGFITDSSGGGDLFVHHTCINGNGFKTLLEGEVVEFEVETDEQGRKKAVNVSGPNGCKVIGDQRGANHRPGYDDRMYNQNAVYGARPQVSRNNYMPRGQPEYNGMHHEYHNSNNGYGGPPGYIPAGMPTNEEYSRPY
jgi:cold shock CspA family protein